MKIKEVKELKVKIVPFSRLSLVIRDEIGPEAINGTLFWCKSPSTFDELEAQPFWANYCRENDFTPGEQLLIEVFL